MQRRVGPSGYGAPSGAPTRPLGGSLLAPGCSHSAATAALEPQEARKAAHTRSPFPGRSQEESGRPSPTRIRCGRQRPRSVRWRTRWQRAVTDRHSNLGWDPPICSSADPVFASCSLCQTPGCISSTPTRPSWATSCVTAHRAYAFRPCQHAIMPSICIAWACHGTRTNRSRSRVRFSGRAASGPTPPTPSGGSRPRC
eukprot:scaffold47417_cov56-Phaeocystis_antarctica.AAC.2